MVKLGDICTFQSGGTPSKSEPAYYNGNIPWITTVALNGSTINEKNAIEMITQKAISESAAKIVPAQSIMVGTRVGVGKVAVNSIPMSTSQDIISLLDIDEQKWDKHFLCKLILAKSEYLNSQARGATIKGIKIDTLSGLKLPELPIETQRKIALTIDKVSDLIALRKQQLAKLDELVKARFVEMFGEPISNSMAWPYMPLSDVCESILGGGTPSKSHPEYFTGHIPWVSPKDMKQAVISDSIDHITAEAISHSTTNLIPANSVLMVIRSGILKHTLPVAINRVPVTINQDMKAFVPSEAITTAFLMHYFKAIESDVLTGVRSVTADNIDFKTFVKRNVIVPPKQLQEQFATFVEQTDKSKLEIQTALTKLETLKKALMQQYFG